MKNFSGIVVAIFLFTSVIFNLSAQDNFSKKYEAFEYRNLGAYRISAWVGSLAVPENPGEKHKYTWYVGPRSGGIWKTVNSGTTFECISNSFGTSSIGDFAVAPSNPEVIWAGTGEAFNRRITLWPTQGRIDRLHIIN